MESCKIKVVDEKKEYFGSYQKKDKLNVVIQDYFEADLFEEKETAQYKELLITTSDNLYYYSPFFIREKINFTASASQELSTGCYFAGKGSINSAEVGSNIKITAITFHHPVISECFRGSCLSTLRKDDHIIFTLQTKNIQRQEVEIKDKNIEKIELGTGYECQYQVHKSVNIQTENFVKLVFSHSISIEELPSYIFEFNAFCNAYVPLGLKVSGVFVHTDNGLDLEYFNTKLIDYETGNNKFYYPVNLDILDFLQLIYKKIDYKSIENKNEYILLDFKKLPSLEDEFLFYFRYLNFHIGKILKAENPGKDVSLYDIMKNFVDNYGYVFQKKGIVVEENLVNEINSLRNHYVHEGYYLPDNKFAVKGKRKQWLYDKEMDYYWLWKLVDALKLGSFIMFYKDVLNVNINEEELSYCLK